jgi:hypothetical protein
VSDKYELPKVRVEVGESRIFTKLFVDGKELRGVTRVWFDTGDIQRDGPSQSWRNSTRVHVEFLPAELILEGSADLDLLEVHPMYAGAKR